MERDTDSLSLAPAGSELFDCLRSEKRKEWESLRSTDYHDLFTAEAFKNLFPVLR